MPRSGGTIAGVIVLIFGGLWVSSSLAQEGTSSQASGSSIAERLGALRDSIFRHQGSSEQPAKKGSATAAASNGQRRRTSPQPGSPASSSSNSRGRSSRASVLPKVEIGDLLPQSLFGGKQSGAKSLSAVPQNRGATDRSAARTRVGSNSSPLAPGTQSHNGAVAPSRARARQSQTDSQNPQFRRSPEPTRPAAARKSPTTVRENELDSALADLLEPASETKQDLSQEKLPVRAGDRQRDSKPRSRPTQAATSKTSIDLRQILLDEVEEEELADRVAESVTEDTDDAEYLLAPPAQQKPAIQSLRADEESESSQVDAGLNSRLAVVSTTDLPSQEPSELVESDRIAEPRALQGVLDSVEVDGASEPFDGSAEQAFQTPREKSQPTPSQEPSGAASDTVSGDVIHNSYRQPVIVSHVDGPRSILVGRESTYQVRLENTSNMTAKEVASVIRVPAWAEVVGVMSTSGQVQRSSTDGATHALEWKLDELAGHASQTLRLRIIPRSGRPLNLGVEWSQAPARAKTLVEVQEPKLEMSLSGPEEVLFGQAQRYLLVLSNPGTGITENVSVRLIPPGGDPKSAVSQNVGNLQPGARKEIGLELTAREAGKLSIDASATAAGGLKVATAKEILCRKAELHVDWRGPQTRYAGTVASYYFRVKNSGTATTDPVEVQLKLPDEAKFIAASEGHSLDSKTGVVTWRLTNIAVDEEQFMQVRCELARAGANDFEVTAQTTSGDLREIKTFQTHVMTLADLKLEVSDPAGAAAVGEAVTYEICVRNRGTAAAENVSVVGLFSEGIDPTSVEGAEFTIRDGRVTFQPIKMLPPDHEVRLRIRATATQAGTHVFRAEAICRELEIKLAVEETTRFYVDDQRLEENQTPYSAERSGNQNR